MPVQAARGPKGYWRPWNECESERERGVREKERESVCRQWKHHKVGIFLRAIIIIVMK